MSTQRGNVSRTRAQKHKNHHAFKNDLHDKTPQQQKLNALHISEVCQHCKGVLEWKIKYKKYKPLSQPKACTRCQQRKILKAYHVLCRDCARAARVCAKCLESADQVDIEPAQPSQSEQMRLRSEMDRLIKSFPERKRRAFLRYMEKGKELENKTEKAESETADDAEEADEEKGEPEKPRRVPHTREELLQKIEQLKLACGENDEEFDFGSDSEDFDDSEEEE